MMQVIFLDQNAIRIAFRGHAADLMPPVEEGPTALVKPQQPALDCSTGTKASKGT